MASSSRLNRINPRNKHQNNDSDAKDKFEDLLVFGYACKLFRDDEKATEIDQGKFLIPWMGDETIMIDRYDGRGALYDLKLFEAPTTSYERFHGLSAEERKMEVRCDEERYFALYKDEAEEAVIREEELKRINQDLCEATSGEVSYRQVPFSYDDADKAGPEIISKEAPVKSIVGELGDSIYIPPPTLDVPPEIAVPPTQKLARIIEKTANFISSQGAQMEIIVKAKQANNPMFQFLHFDSPLHPFYRHILTAIRNGTYTVIAEEENETNVKESSANEETVGQAIQKEINPSIEPEPSSDLVIHEPSSEVKALIDKTASFMSKHSRDLESVVLAKGGDPRFTFLNSQHPFHAYYMEKYTLYKSLFDAQQLAIRAAQESAKTAAATQSLLAQDAELKQNERRKKAALFLNRIKKSSNTGGDDGKTAAENKSTEADSPRSIAKETSRSPDEIEIIGSVRKERTHSRSRSRSVQKEHRKVRRSRSRSRSYERYNRRSRSKISGRSRSRSRHRSRSGSRLSGRRSPTPERYRHRHRKKHRSRERHKKEKKRRCSRERRDRKKRRRRSRSPISSLSPSPSRSRSPVHSRTASPSSKKSTERAPSPVGSSVPPKMADNSKSGSETSSPLPAQLLTTQPVFAKLAEGIRAKVIAMIEGDVKK